MTDGAFRPYGGFAAMTEHDAAVLAEAWRHPVPVLFVRQDWPETDAAAAMPSWPYSGFSVYVGPRIEREDRASVLWVARYGAMSYRRATAGGNAPRESPRTAARAPAGLRGVGSR